MSHDLNNENLGKLRAAREELLLLSEFLYLPSLQATEFVETALPMANQLATLEEKAEAYFLTNHGRLLDAASTVPTDTDIELSTESALEDDVALFWESTVEARLKFRQMLELIHDGESGASRRVTKYINESVEDLVLVPSIIWDGSGPRRTIKYCALDIRGVLGYALMLLLDSDEHQIGPIRKCKLASCGDFFLSIPGDKGGRPRLHCRDEHRLQAAALTGAERTARWRKKKQARESKRDMT